jgi:hypothetical protein
MRSISLVVVALGLLFAAGLSAFGGPAVVAADAWRANATAVGPSFPRHERITCTTAAGGVEIKPTGSYQMVSYECTARGAVAVGSTTGGGTALSFANGVEYASGDRFGANVAAPERCISGGSVVIECRFLVTSP